jgi:hypothetical protein
LRVAADVTQGFGGKVKADAALTHLAAGRQQGISEAADLFLRLTQQVECQPLGGAGTYTRQPFELVDQPGQGSGVTAQGFVAAGLNLGSPMLRGGE